MKVRRREDLAFWSDSGVERVDRCVTEGMVETERWMWKWGCGCGNGDVVVEVDTWKWICGCGGEIDVIQISPNRSDDGRCEKEMGCEVEAPTLQSIHTPFSL